MVKLNIKEIVNKLLITLMQNPFICHKFYVPLYYKGNKLK